MLAEILEPIMGKGLIPADLETWRVRRRAIVPAFHAKYYEAMGAMFARCTGVTLGKLGKAAADGCVGGGCVALCCVVSCCVVLCCVVLCCVCACVRVCGGGGQSEAAAARGLF